MKKLSYAEQLKHPNWQKKRLEVLSSKNFKCEGCDSSEEMLHVHHKFYKKNAMAWEYELNDFQCLCETCHSILHYEKDLLTKITNNFIYSEHGEAAALLNGYFNYLNSEDSKNLNCLNPMLYEAGQIANFIFKGNLRLVDVINLKNKLIERMPNEDLTVKMKKSEL